MKLSLSTLFLTLTAAAAADNSFHEIFESIKEENTASIRSVVENDPSALESIGPGGQGPLIRAVLTGKAAAVDTLLELGADLATTERDGYNVLHAAGFQGRAEILEVLLQKFAEQKARGGFYLDPSTDMHRDGFYPLHRACWGDLPRHTETVKVFLKHGVSPDQPSEEGATCAEMTDNEEIKAVLMEAQHGYEL
mmetsp:Transcript_34570/g.81501  ORF Transcript_34570/g.81501 Transcript_34570/m.81501 type:complete len:194 (-) Transcript_34570:65-646(-)